MKYIFVFFLIFTSCTPKTQKSLWNFDGEAPIRSGYPKDVTKFIKKRQEKYRQNVYKVLKEEYGLLKLSTITAALSQSRPERSIEGQMEFLSTQIRYTKYESATDRGDITMDFQRILKNAAALNYSSPNFYVVPVAAPFFSAFTTPLPQLSSKFNAGHLIELNSGNKKVLDDLTEVIFAAAFSTSEVWKDSSVTYEIRLRGEDSVGYIIHNDSLLQRSFNKIVLESCFADYKYKDLYRVRGVNENYRVVVVASANANRFISAHEYAHILLNHNSKLVPLQFNGLDSVPQKKEILQVSSPGFDQEFQADSLAAEMAFAGGDRGGNFPLAFIWIDILERVRNERFKYPVYITHPPTSQRIERVRNLIRGKKYDTKIFDLLLYTYNRLWEGFQPELQSHKD